jgi:sec-independent protein translocase protein TatB
MGSISFTEILVIAVVALIVFGPKRLPELARRAGELVAKAREASSSLTDALGPDYSDVVEPLKGVKDDVTGIRDDLTKAVTSIGELDDSSIRSPEDDASDTPRPDDGVDPTTGTPDEKKRDEATDAPEDGPADTETP